jgi:phosphonate transport system substrate-binding protein
MAKPWWLAVFGIILGVAARAAEPPLIFGVLNQQSPAQTAEKWNPILRYLGETTGLNLQFKMGATVQETDAMMGRGEFDFVYTNHNFQREYDGMYRVIARWSGEPIHGVIVVAEDSPARALKDLQGQRVAFPSADAFVAYAVPSVALRADGVKVEEVFAGNQDSALVQLRAKQVKAAAVNSRFLEQYAKKEGVRFRALYTSEPYAELPVIAHGRVPKESVALVRNALLNMKQDPKAAPILDKAKSKGFDAASDKDYDNVRKIYRAIGQ